MVKKTQITPPPPSRRIAHTGDYSEILKRERRVKEIKQLRPTKRRQNQIKYHERRIRKLNFDWDPW